MRKCFLYILAILILFGVSQNAFAVDPDIKLEDPALETRAVEITRQLRCPKCVSQSVESSDVGISRDLQLLVRERVLAGESDAEILEFVAARYGDFVLLKPRFNMANALLWFLPFVLFVGVVVFLVWRAHKQQQSRLVTGQAKLLTDGEAKTLQSLLEKQDQP